VVIVLFSAVTADYLFRYFADRPYAGRSQHLKNDQFTMKLRAMTWSLVFVVLLLFIRYVFFGTTDVLRLNHLDAELYTALSS